MSSSRSPIGSSAALLSLFMLVACGGGSDSSEVSQNPPTGNAPSPAPAPAPAPAPSPAPSPAPAPAPAPSPAPAPAPASDTAFSAIDTGNRAEVLARYQDGFLALRKTSFSWTGNVAGCAAGDTPLAYKNAVVKLVNYYRAMAGLPGDVTLSLPKSAQAQQAALMFDANDQLSHAPPATWKCYTADGATAAGKSNIAWGTNLNGASANSSGIGSIPLYVMDGGVASLGHRRWVFSLVLGEVGTGDTPQGNALWVLGTTHTATSVPNGMSWPPRGYVPWDSSIAEPAMRWSFSYPGADFSAATVTMTDDAGVAVPVTGVGELDRNYAENTMAWSIGGSGQPWSRAPADTKLGVTVSNVKIGGVAKSFSYSVTFIKP